MHTNNSYQAITCTVDEMSLLEALLDAGNQFVSGHMLAKLTGISQSTISNKLEKLRTEDFDIEAVIDRGYRLTEKPEILHPALLGCYLKKAAMELDVLHFPVLDSTNSEAERQYLNGRKSPFVITSGFQTQGRGRLGRAWHSASAKNLYLSVHFEPKISPSELQSFTLWVGICICRILQKNIPGVPLRIKWPNDLYCGGRKFAGMLTEAKMDSGNLRSIIFGIGINVNSNPLDYPDGLSSSATSLYAISGEELSLNLLTVQVLQAIKQAYDICICDETPESLTEAWAPLDALSGKTITILQSGKELSGVVQGIDASGALLLLLPDQTIRSIRAGEVTVKK